MRFVTLLSAACLATALPLAAQQDHFTTSPPGYENVEGSTSLDLIGSAASLRYQQVIAGDANALTNRNRIAFRRDGLLPDNASYAGRTITLELVLSEADMATFGTDFAANRTSNTTTVIASKPVSFDSYVVAPAAGSTATEAPILLFDSGITWSKPLGAHYLFDLKITGNDKAGQPYPMDADAFIDNVSFGPSVSHNNGGCTVPGQGEEMSAEMGIANDGSQFDIDLGIDAGAPSAPAVMLIDTAIANNGNGVSLGFCNNVYVLGGLTLNLTLDPNGGWAQGFTVNYDASAIGLNLHAQSACPDASQPGGLAVSSAVTTTIPGDPTGQSTVSYVYELDANATHSTGTVHSGGVILWTNHP